MAAHRSHRSFLFLRGRGVCRPFDMGDATVNRPKRKPPRRRDATRRDATTPSPTSRIKDPDPTFNVFLRKKARPYWYAAPPFRPTTKNHENPFETFGIFPTLWTRKRISPLFAALALPLTILQISCFQCISYVGIYFHVSSKFCPVAWIFTFLLFNMPSLHLKFNQIKIIGIL